MTTPVKITTFQQLILTLQQYWAEQGCALMQPLDMEVGAGTFHPATFLRALGPEPWNAAFVQPCRRPTDGRYAQNPNRVQYYYQFQVVMKPSPINIQELYLNSLRAIGIDPLVHDIRFVEDNWESPTLGAWGLGWEVWQNGMEISQFTYFQQLGGLECRPITGELTYGLERLAMFLFGVDSIFDLVWTDGPFGKITYGDVFRQNEIEMSTYHFEQAKVPELFQQFDFYEQEAKRLMELNLPLPAYEMVIKASHTFNILDARKAISVTERQRFILRVRTLARTVAESYYASREALNFPMGDCMAAAKVDNSFMSKSPQEPQPQAAGSKVEPGSQLNTNPTNPNSTTPQPALIELGCEELPPKLLKKLSEAFVHEVETLLTQAKITYKKIHPIAAPRRLGLIIDDLATTQPNQTTIRKGPAINAGLNAAGEPTPALQGFMRSVNVTNVADLQREETDKGAWFTATIQQIGKSTAELLPEIINAALKRLPIPKPMRWGNRLDEFVRPVHWVVMLLGNDVVPGTVLGVQTGNQSRGHRFMAPEAIEIKHPSEYLEKLKNAYVLADFSRRHDLIAEQVQKVAAQLKAQVDLNPDLLDEVTGIVEWPVPIAVPFSAEFLRVPNEALTAAMRDHQKCFSLYDDQQKLLPQFITVANIASQDVNAVIAGNERVMRARLSDAAFFFDEDNKQKITDWLPRLKTVIFQEKLGTVYDKSERIAKLAGFIAKQFNVDEKLAERAGLLCKCDLMSNMVGEFPELQGIMGAYYARSSQEPEQVATALREYYHPAFAKDQLPSDAISDAVALAERLDTLVGIFSIQKPTGEKDPYGLRRAALGVVRILIEKKYTLNVKQLLEFAVLQYQGAIKDPAIIEEVHQFILERLKGWYQEAGIPLDAISAVLARETNNFYDVDRCLQAVQAFRQLPEATALAAANKRVSRILQKEQVTQTTLNPSVLQDAAEQQLAEQVIALREKLRPLCERGEYQTVLFALAELQQPIDRFFDEVMVMADDVEVRNNRLALLAELRQLFLRVADISLLQ